LTLILTMMITPKNNTYMTHAIIPTDNYLLVLDGSEIEVGDYMYFWNGQSGAVHKHKEGFTTDNIYGSGIKVVAHWPLNSSPVLEGVPLLQQFVQGEDVYRLFNEDSFEVEVDGHSAWTTYSAGYNKAKEQVADTIRWIDESILTNPYYANSPRLREGAFIVKVRLERLFQPKTPIAFECLMDTARIPNGDDGWKTIETGIRTTTNPQGQTVWLGKYIYE